VEFEDEIRLNHTDAFGVLYWGAVSTFAQRGVEEFLARSGHPLSSYIDRTIDYVIRHAEFDYILPLVLGSRVTVVTSIEKVGTTSFTALTRLLSDGEPAVEIRQVLVCFDRERKVSVPVEPWLTQLAP